MLRSQYDLIFEIPVIKLIFIDRNKSNMITFNFRKHDVIHLIVFLLSNILNYKNNKKRYNLVMCILKKFITVKVYQFFFNE